MTGGNCTKSGYVFNGWTCAYGNNWGNSCVDITNATQVLNNLSDGENIKLTAKWVKCDPCNGSNVDCEITLDSNSQCVYSTTCKQGYGHIEDNGTIDAECSLCKKGYYCPGVTPQNPSGNEVPCPAATTTRCSTNSLNHFLSTDVTDADCVANKGATSIKACALVGGKSKICDTGNPPVCYELTNSSPIHWGG